MFLWDLLPKGCTEVVHAHSFWDALCVGPAYLVYAYVLYRQPECSELKDYLQFLMSALVLKIILSFEFFLDAQIGGVVSRDIYIFVVGICVERIVWVL